MRKIIRLLIPMTGLAAVAASAQAKESDPLYNQALKRMLASSYQGWSFTRTKTAEGKVTVEQYSDSRKPGQRWQLISIDGAIPTKQQLEDYQTQKRKELKKKKTAGKSDRDSNRFLATLVRPGSLSLVRQGPLRSSYRFQPVMDKNDKNMESYILGTMTIRRDNPMIEQIHIYNKQEFSAYRAKIKQFNQLMRFAPADPDQPKTSPVFLTSVNNEIKGKALFLFNFEQKTAIEFSDYRKAAR